MVLQGILRKPNQKHERPLKKVKLHEGPRGPERPGGRLGRRIPTIRWHEGPDEAIHDERRSRPMLVQDGELRGIDLYHRLCTPGTEEHRMFMCKPMKPPPLNCPVSRPPPPTWFNSPLRRKMKAPPRNCPVAEVCVGPWICNLPFEICNLPEMKPDLAEICNPPVTSVPSTPQVTNWQQCQAEIVDWPVNSVPLTPQESKWQFEDASQSSQESCESV